MGRGGEEDGEGRGGGSFDVDMEWMSVFVRVI